MNTTLFEGKRVLITGGTGFIGSNLTAALIPLGARVTLLAHSTGHLKFIQDIIEMGRKKNSLDITLGDLRNSEEMQRVVQGQDFIFNLAAQVSHLDKGIVSHDDLAINVAGQLTFLEAVCLKNPDAKVVFSSTRMVYGDDAKSPITESEPTNPVTDYGAHKLAGEKYHLIRHKKNGLRCTILRISNPYGDRQHFSKGRYNLPGWFMRRIMNGETVTIFTDGKQGRDYIYIGDLVDLMLAVCATDTTDGNIYNAGSGIHNTFGDMVDALVQVVPGPGKIIFTDKPTVENDGYNFDISRLAEDIKWKPETSLIDGIRRMHAFAEKYPCKE